MVLPVEEIKKGIVHPDPFVRQQAMNYFAESWSTDATIMPLAVEALKTYGWDDAFKWSKMLRDLPQTQETFLWFVGELEKGTAPPVAWKRDFIDPLSDIIAAADVALLREHQAKILELPELPYGAKRDIKERLRMSLLDFNACWRELEEECEKARDGDHEAVDVEKGDHLAEAIGRHRRAGERVLPILSVKVDNPVKEWMQVFAVKAAGELRQQAAIPALLAMFQKDDGLGNEGAAIALGRIGGDLVVEAICHDFAKQHRDYRYNSVAALEQIRSPLVVSKCLELLEAEDDGDARFSLATAAVNNFASEAIDPARQCIQHDQRDHLKERLVGVATLMGIAFPELATWKQELEDEARGIRQRLVAKREWTAPAAPEPPPEPLRPIKAAPKVGRNDPCPCGSGKKYKKCCMDK